MTPDKLAGIVVADPAAPGGIRLLGPDDVAAELRALVGRRLPGGCADCRAEHEYREDVADVFDMLVFHAGACPVLRDVR